VLVEKPKGVVQMADMKMKRDGLGGYLLTLTPGQVKKWEHLGKEINTVGLIPNKKWKPEPYEIAIADDIYQVVIEADESKKHFGVTLASKADPSRTNTKVYRTWECNDCIMRMMLELHNAHLAQLKKEAAEKKAAEQADKKKA
jgi:hypothetical protein